MAISVFNECLQRAWRTRMCPDNGGDGGGNIDVPPVFTAPVITSVDTVTVLEAAPFNLQCTAVGSNTADCPLRWTLTSQPSWLSINPVTGLIKGNVPKGVNTYTAMVHAMNCVGADDQLLTIHVVQAQAVFKVYLGNTFDATSNRTYNGEDILNLENMMPDPNFHNYYEVSQIEGTYQIAQKDGGFNVYQLFCTPETKDVSGLTAIRVGIDPNYFTLFQSNVDIGDGTLYKIYRSKVPSPGNFTNSTSRPVVVTT